MEVTTCQVKSPTHVRMFYAVEAEWFAVRNAGDSADEGVPDAVFEWLWTWWWPFTSHGTWQVQKFWETIVQTAVIGVLVLASDVDWLAGISDKSLGQTSAEEADWT